jgi:hypothetical protein
MDFFEFKDFRSQIRGFQELVGKLTKTGELDTFSGFSGMSGSSLLIWELNIVILESVIQMNNKYLMIGSN